VSKRDNKKVKLYKRGILVTPKLVEKEDYMLFQGETIFIELDITWFVIRGHLRGWMIRATSFDLVVILHKDALDNTYYPTCLVACYPCLHPPQWKNVQNRKI
jgi:hypothetical protein